MTITEIKPADPSRSSMERAKAKLERDLGPDLLAALYDSKTVELMLNPNGTVWLERLGEPLKQIGTLDRFRGQSILEQVAGYLNKTITRDEPILEGEFPLDGSRFAGQLPPLVQGPTFALRKKAIKVFTLDQYVEMNIMTPAHYDVIRNAVKARRNILVVGGTGSGKTTLVNAIINEMVVVRPMDRVVIIEDTGEIQCNAANYIQYHTTTRVSMTDLLKTTLRMRPDRILVGEVRDGAALDLLDAWNTGHEGGAATLHANSAEEGLLRLRSLVTRNAHAPAEIEPIIGSVVHYIVHIARTEEHGRLVRDVLEISGYENGKYITRSH